MTGNISTRKIALSLRFNLNTDIFGVEIFAGSDVNQLQ